MIKLVFLRYDESVISWFLEQNYFYGFRGSKYVYITWLDLKNNSDCIARS